MAIHTDGNEQISVVSFSPGKGQGLGPRRGKAWELSLGAAVRGTGWGLCGWAWDCSGDGAWDCGAAWDSGGLNLSEEGAEPGCLLIAPSPPPDGAYLAVGSHDNLVYVYKVDQGGRKVSRLGKCSVSGQWPRPAPPPCLGGAELTSFLPQGSTASTFN